MVAGATLRDRLGTGDLVETSQVGVFVIGTQQRRWIQRRLVLST